MNDSKFETDKIVAQFKEVIQKRFKCDSEYISKVTSDLTSEGYGKGEIFSFKLLGQSEKHPDAKQCFVFYGENFKPGSNETVVVFDVQVTEDKPNRLPEVAVWFWAKDLLDKCIDNYVTSSKWKKDDLHNELVQFHELNPLPKRGENATGRFFVRTRDDGKIAVRIVLSNNSSICLTSNQIERIERLPESGAFWLTLNR